MLRRPSYELIYDPDVRRQLGRIERKHHPLIRRAIEEQLTHEPETETRDQKPLLRPSVLGPAWELRCGPQNRFRVFYRVDRSHRHVYILAIGVKIRERLMIAGEEFEL